MPAMKAEIIKRLFEILREQLGFQALRNTLKQENFETEASREKTLEALLKLSGDEANRAIDVMRGLSANLVVAGTKEVFVYELDANLLRVLEQSMLHLTRGTDEYRDSFPLPLTPTALGDKGADHELAHRTVSANGDITLVFCARRSQEDRTTYQYNEVTEAVQQAFVGSAEFIVVRRVDYQIFDVITLRKSLSRLEVLIDQPSKIRAPVTVESRCRNLIGDLSINPGFDTVYESLVPMNLASCISNLYHAAAEGGVSDLKFRAPTGSTNRASISKKDLRKENFHKKGVEAVGDVAVHDISMTWENLVHNQGDVTVQIGMSAKAMSDGNAVVSHARIIDARTNAVVLAVVNKLVSYST